MSQELAMWAIGIGFSLVAGGWALVKAFAYLGQRLIEGFDKRLNERFAAISRELQEIKVVGNERLSRLEAKYEELDRDVRRILIELPRDYVARSDYIRRETVMEAKIDQLSLRLENWFLKGGEAKHDR